MTTVVSSNSIQKSPFSFPRDTRDRKSWQTALPTALVRYAASRASRSWRGLP